MLGALVSSGASAATDAADPTALQGPTVGIDPHWAMAGRNQLWHSYRASSVGASRVQRLTTLTDISSLGIVLFTIERQANLGRKADRLGARRERESHSSMLVTYATPFEDAGRLWVSAGLSAQRKRLMTAIVGGHVMKTGEASISAGWVQDDHWQLSARYLIDQLSSRHANWRRAIELSAGARASGSSMVAGISYSPDFQNAVAPRVGIAARRDRIASGDAQVMTMSGRDRSSIALSFSTGF
ncbi:hypothetical protein [Sphingomonas montanisoli]|uniref:Uncharacterized protein n=1 Tax=Sphingomonas montanisoli TaxID=2606412 RepID=A0A5D9CD04_9SPHN|nr:hypothetical protein [Sphingomonas montanisoli]TZG29554.1 hypothetical protein FYJ91_05380 [Sphingomonas montanisoli]